MKKCANFIVEMRYLIIVLFIALAGLGIYLSTTVNINYDIKEYLPKNSETRIGMNKMKEEFGEEETSTLYVMFKDIDGKEKKILKQLEAIKGVESVDYDSSKDYNKDGYTLYILNVNDTAKSKTATKVYNTVEKDFSDYQKAYSGTIGEENKPVLKIWVVALAIVCAMIILIIMCDSYVEPFLFLFTIGLAVFINKGTNIMFPSVSHITDSICAVLQMALSMDYSIMLMNRYTQEKEKTKDKKEAMKKALANAFGSISSSSVTTIVGLLALVFMSFTIGRDLGYVLAKGVLLSLICIFAVLPGLILMFDDLIAKTKKKSLELKLDKLGELSYKLRYPAVLLIIALFIIAFMLKGNLQILYTANENDEVAQVFEENNQMAIIYNNKNEDKVAELCRNINNKKAGQVLCYGNTINQKLTYKELKKKMNDLGANVDIDDYLLRIVYYDYYYGNKTNTIALNQLINFIENDIYTNDKMSTHVDNSTKENIDKLKYFATSSEINKKRSTTELASILGIEKDKLDKLMILYHSKNTNSVLSINSFVNFMYSDVLPDPTFSSFVDNDTRNSLNTLRNFIDKNSLYTKYDSNTMANIFGIDNNSMSNLYLYYYSINGVDKTNTINEFSNFLLNNVVTNPIYSSMFTSEQIASLQQLKTFSDSNIINKEMTSTELASTLGMDEETIKSILLMRNINNATNYSLKDFVEYVDYLRENTNYLDDIDFTRLDTIKTFIVDQTGIDTNNLDKYTLNYLFQNIDNDLVNNVYDYLGIDDTTNMTILDFIGTAINNYQQIDPDTYQTLVELKDILENTINNNSYSLEDIVNYLPISDEVVNEINNIKNNLNSATPYEIVDFLINNKDNPLISNNLDSNTLNKLYTAKTIMNTNNSLDYTTMSNLTGIDLPTVRSLYALEYKDTYTLNKVELVKFILEHKNDAQLSSIDSSTINKLYILNNVMNGVINNKYYNSYELSNLLGIDKDSIDLLYSFYDIKEGYSEDLSLKELVEFIISDVLPNSRFNSNFDDSSTSKLNTVNLVMNNSLSNYKYNSKNLYNTLLGLSDGLDKNLFDLVYLYYGSVYDYDTTSKLTVEEFINYLNSDVLKDTRFNDFIDKDMRKTIKDGKTTVSKAKKLLVGDKYSRVVINSEFGAEDKDTFKFIKNMKNNLNNIGNDIYMIGNSPMAYDLDKSFGSEFDFISILTMIFIFVVVAITFKSVIIPLVLTLIIQCAVYIIMGILSLFGGNVYFIALLIVQSILMGATIDYAILFTSYYLEFRHQKQDIKESLINAYNNSIHTILTSASVLIIVTFIVGFFASAIAAKICMTISQGTLCSTILVLFILPSVLASLDKFIVKEK